MLLLRILVPGNGYGVVALVVALVGDGVPPSAAAPPLMPDVSPPRHLPL